MSNSLPMPLSQMSIDNGGTLSAIDAYSDGVGVLIIGDVVNKIDNSAMNTLVFKYGNEAKDLSATIADQVLLGTPNAPELDIALAGQLNNVTTQGGGTPPPPPPPVVSFDDCYNDTFVGNYTANDSTINCYNNISVLNPNWGSLTSVDHFGLSAITNENMDLSLLKNITVNLEFWISSVTFNPTSQLFKTSPNDLQVSVTSNPNLTSLKLLGNQKIGLGNFSNNPNLTDISNLNVSTDLFYLNIINDTKVTDLSVLNNVQFHGGSVSIYLDNRNYPTKIDGNSFLCNPTWGFFIDGDGNPVPRNLVCNPI